MPFSDRAGQLNTLVSFNLMAREIIIVKDTSKPYWEQDGTFTLGGVNPAEFGSLFNKEFDIKSIFEYIAEGGDRQTYQNYYSKQICLVEEKFPLIARAKDYYEDARFSKDEIVGLIKELLSLKKIVRFEKSKRYLDQMLATSEIALSNDSGMQIIAD